MYRKALASCKLFLYKQGTSILNALIPIWFLNSVFGVNLMLHDHILDYMHGEGTQVATAVRLTVWFMSAEMLINWVFLCTVKSNYDNTEENNRKRVEHEQKYPQFVSEGVEYDQLKEKRPTLGTGNWSVVTQYTGSEVRRTAYPYWSWKPCMVCSYYKPPRCHHCPICKNCILKRDHHCFFARQCVGLNNQRYFVVFNLWATLVTCFVTPQLVYYIRSDVWPGMTSCFELFLPWTIVSFLAGWTKPYTFYIIFQCYSLTSFIFTASFFLLEQLKCIDQGRTSYEQEIKKQTIVTQYKSRYERFACVFGRRHIWLNILSPYHWASKPTDDAINWESMKME